jgi:hypothetical protein
MRPTISNAFKIPDQGNKTPLAGTAKQSGKIPISLLPLHAVLTSRPYGWNLALSPMRAVDTITALHRTSRRCMVAIMLSDEPSTEPHLTEVAERLGIPVHHHLGRGSLALSYDSALDLAAFLEARSYYAVIVDGPIEASDLRALRRAVDVGTSPLSAEVRAIAVIAVQPKHSIQVQTRWKVHAMAVLAEDFRQYIAATRGQTAEGIGRPEQRHLESLMSRSGSVGILPQETRCYSTFIDVGLRTLFSHQTDPADLSLVYDLIGGVWHSPE